MTKHYKLYNYSNDKLLCNIVRQIKNKPYYYRLKYKYTSI